MPNALLNLDLQSIFFFLLSISQKKKKKSIFINGTKKNDIGKGKPCAELHQSEPDSSELSLGFHFMG